MRGGAEQQVSDLVRRGAREQRLHVDIAAAGERRHPIDVNRREGADAEPRVDQRIAERDQIPLLRREMRRQSDEPDRELVRGQRPQARVGVALNERDVAAHPGQTDAGVFENRCRLGERDGKILQRVRRVVCPHDDVKVRIDDGAMRRRGEPHARPTRKRDRRTAPTALTSDASHRRADAIRTDK